jgi:regulator of protease activity HflC (stomatin/prohibitin superfamily)
MGTALDWIGQIAAWIGQWIPRWRIVAPTEAAVKAEGFFLPRSLRVRFRGFDGDMRLTPCGPGLHWYWPATTLMDTYPTKFQSDNLPSQTFETADDKTITVGGVVSYTVIDIIKAITGTHSAMKTIQVHTLAAIHEVCCRMTLDELNTEQRRGTLKTKLRNQAQTPLAEFGVKIEDCRLTDKARSRALRLIQSTQQDDA